MWTWLKTQQEKWAGWISDSELERSLRAHLSGQGFYGDTAKFRTFRLVAIQRPGWLQVYSFSVEAKVADEQVTAGTWVMLFGLVRRDERYRRCDIRVFREGARRHGLYDEWTAELIRLRRPNL
jgi:hypothetical protein